MTVHITLDVPEESLSVFRAGPDEFARQMRLAAVVKWYEMGRVSQSKAAELAGMSRREFLDTLHEFQVSPFQITPEDLAAEAAHE